MVDPAEIKNITELKLGMSNKVRELATIYLTPLINDREKGTSESIKKIADATAAIEVVCSLVNVFGVSAGIRNYSPELAISDLVFTLNTNTFWVKNASYLMPLVNAAINAFLDNNLLKMSVESLWAKLEYHHRNAWLEILPAILFCLYGQKAMREKSLEMKKAFESLNG